MSTMILSGLDVEISFGSVAFERIQASQVVGPVAWFCRLNNIALGISSLFLTYSKGKADSAELYFPYSAETEEAILNNAIETIQVVYSIAGVETLMFSGLITGVTDYLSKDTGSVKLSCQSSTSSENTRIFSSVFASYFSTRDGIARFRFPAHIAPLVGDSVFDEETSTYYLITTAKYIISAGKSGNINHFCEVLSNYG